MAGIAVRSYRGPAMGRTPDDWVGNAMIVLGVLGLLLNGYVLVTGRRLPWAVGDSGQSRAARRAYALLVGAFGLFLVGIAVAARLAADQVGELLALGLVAFGVIAVLVYVLRDWIRSMRGSRQK
jgi:amino acid permease